MRERQGIPVKDEDVMTEAKVGWCSLRMEEEATKQEMRVASAHFLKSIFPASSWKSQVNKPSSRITRKNTALRGPWFVAITSVLDLWPPELWTNRSFFFFFFVFSWHTEVPRLGVELKLQLPTYTTATATPDPSHVCNLHHSSWQCRILSPLSKARNRTHNLIVPSQILFCCAKTRTSKSFFFPLLWLPHSIWRCWARGQSCIPVLSRHCWTHCVTAGTPNSEVLEKTILPSASPTKTSLEHKICIRVTTLGFTSLGGDACSRTSSEPSSRTAWKRMLG